MTTNHQSQPALVPYWRWSSSNVFLPSPLAVSPPRRVRSILGRCFAWWRRSRCLGTFPCCLDSSGNLNRLLTLPSLPYDIFTVAFRDNLEPRAIFCPSLLGNAIILLCLAWTTTASHPAFWRINQLDRATDQGSLNANGTACLSFERCRYAYIHM